MYRNVLIPLDLSEREHTLVESAARIIDPETGSVTLLHVIEEIEGLAGEEGELFYAGLRERAGKVLEARAGLFGRSGIGIRQEIIVGKRASAIVGFASEQRCDLIVMSAERIDPAQPERSLWSTPQKVSLLADCPILLIR
ncbi:MAG: universal stress protein [Deltaproteobacteria bacterium]|jgi:nucleotide-binding universal stress UspA family protein|nr:universal stress protein [Deltaproteobacteria bacterium]MBW2382749.1 universal stress protein [Deltaproteobacteria bacterium]MBW2698972.1 universal stress protein [Deltaproteobacteria bacterium]